MKTWLLATMIVTGIAASAETRILTTVYVSHDVDVPERAVTNAAQHAAGVFADIDVPVRFVVGAPGKHTKPTGVVIQMRINAYADGNASQSAVGHAQLSGANAAIQLFYSRIKAYEPSACRDALLGYAMAHEVGHVLQGIARHSESGVMKARWDRTDVWQMHSNRLQFETGDRDLIQIGIANRLAAQK